MPLSQPCTAAVAVTFIQAPAATCWLMIGAEQKLVGKLFVTQPSELQVELGLQDSFMVAVEMLGELPPEADL